MNNQPKIIDINLKDKIVQSIKIAISGGAAAASTVDPTIGVIAASLSTAICELLPNYRQKNQEELLSQLAIEFYKLKDEMDEDFLKKDEFAYLLNKCLRLALEEIDNTKRRAYINILTNSCIHPDEFKQIDFYLSVLLSLSSLEVHTIALFNNPGGYLEIRGIEKESVTGGMKSVLKKSFPELTEDEFRMILTMLFNKDLTNTPADILETLTASTGLKLAEGRLTESGKKLIKYSSDYKNRL